MKGTVSKLITCKGNLKDPQPKAVGSTILSRLTHKLVVSSLRAWGFNKLILAGGVNVMPVCTGMSMMLALMAVASKKKKVIWLRIDQKSCLKAILAANLEVIVVEGKSVGDEIVTDLRRVEEIIESEAGEIHSIVSCVSCFAPRAPDSIFQLSRLASKHQIAHIVNAAYGGTSARACNLLNGAVDAGGRIDAVVMSLDKNFMVPVGGAIIFGPQKEKIERIGARYAGRAGMSHLIDLFITMVRLGRKGILAMKSGRLECFEYFKEKLREVEGVKVMETDHNDISIALRLPKTASTSLGSQLFHRNISGARVIEIKNNKSTILEGIELKQFGSHYSGWEGEFCYLNVAAGVGCESKDIEIFIKKLNKLLK
jgi:O-phospho-L-seryl-tRNASec:L-selenocysteinyl-tRNA synthase